jgi:hypothetical protein
MGHPPRFLIKKCFSPRTPLEYLSHIFLFFQCHRGRFHTRGIRRPGGILVAIEYGVQHGGRMLSFDTLRCELLHGHQSADVVVVVVGWKLHDDEYDVRMHVGFFPRFGKLVRLRWGSIRRDGGWGGHRQQNSRCDESVHVSSNPTIHVV